MLDIFKVVLYLIKSTNPGTNRLIRLCEFLSHTLFMRQLAQHNLPVSRAKLHMATLASCGGITAPPDHLHYRT